MDPERLSIVAAVEFCIVFCLSSTTLILRYFIHRHKSVKSMWAVCPVLCVLLLSVVPQALLNLFIPVLWNAVIFGFVENRPETVYVLVMPTLTGIAFNNLYNSVTIAVFLQRIFCLLSPSNNNKKLNLSAASMLGAFAVGTSIAEFVITFNKISFVDDPLPPGCFAFNCLTAMSGQFPSVVFSLASFAILFTGTTMFGLVYRYRKQRHNATNVKINRFSLYVFYARLIFETTPFLLDVILSQAVGIHLGQYVGPFGALGSALDLTTTTFMYFQLTRQRPKVFIASSR